jgi:nitrous oxidase accessory protein NosD
MFPVLTQWHVQPAQHAPIVINSNDDFTSDNGVTGGSGTSDDPYVITGWNISDPPGNGITIRNTDAHFIISGILIRWTYTDCSIQQCWKHPPNGLLLESVKHGAVMDSQVDLSSGRYALNITFSDDVRVSDNDLRIGDGHVVILKMSSNLEISNNRLGGGALTMSGSYLTNVSITGNSGGAEDGIGLAHVNNILFSKNTIAGHSTFGFSDCNNVTIDSNAAFGHDGGIFVSNCESFGIHGNMVKGTAFPVNDPGIEVVNSSNFDISANNVTDFRIGLSLVAASEFSVDSFQCSSCSTGILVNGASAGLIQNSEASSDYSSGIGLQMSSSDNILVQNNHLRGLGWALILKDSSSLDVRNNELLGDSGNMMQGTGLDDVNIQDNYGGAEAGAQLFNVTNVSISNNRFAVSSFSGLMIRGCSDVTIAGNNVTGNGNHFLIQDCTNVSISQNTALGFSGEGISLMKSTGVSVSDNQVSHLKVGVSLVWGSTGNSVNNNLIANNVCGIQTDKSTVDQNDLSNNTFQANTQDYCSA